MKRLWLALLPLFALHAVTQPEATVFPQIVDGGGWRTSMAFVNIEPYTVVFRVYFLGTNGRELPLPLERLGTSSYVDFVLLSGQTESIATAGAAERLTQGYAVVRKNYSSDVIGGLAVLRHSLQGGGEEEVSYELQPENSRRSLLVFENMADTATTVAVANVSAYSMGLRALVRDTKGVVVGDESMVLAPFEQRAFALADAFPATRLRHGSIEWIAEPASFAMVAFRFAPNGIRAIPAYQHPNWQ